MPSDDEYEPSEVNSSDTPYDEESPSPVGSPDFCRDTFILR